MRLITYAEAKSKIAQSVEGEKIQVYCLRYVI